MQAKEKVQVPFTAIFIEDPTDKGYTAYFAEFPEVIAEGDTEKEAEENLFEALIIMLEVKKQEMKKDQHFSENSRIKQFQLEVMA